VDEAIAAFYQGGAIWSDLLQIKRQSAAMLASAVANFVVP
jgi:hypothetical protein